YFFISCCTRRSALGLTALLLTATSLNADVLSPALQSDPASTAPPGVTSTVEETHFTAPPIETVTVTATRRIVDRRAVAMALTRVDEGALLRDGPSVIAEALRAKPGAFFQQTTPGQGTPIVRGLKGSQLLHLVDGMRLNNAFFRDAPNQYLALVDAQAVAAIEVLRGAAGSLYGADAMGGVVALNTRESRFTGPDTSTTGRFFSRYDSADHGVLVRAEGAVGNERGSLAGGVLYQHRGNRRTGDGTTVRPSGFEAEAANLKLLLDQGARGEWMLQAQALEQPATPRVDALVPGFGQETPSSETFLFEPNRRTFLHGRYRQDGVSGPLQRWELNLARQVIVDDRRTQDFGSVIENREQNESTLDGLTAQINLLLKDQLDLVLGVELYRDEVRSSRQLVNLETGASEDVRGRFPDGDTHDSDAIYAQVNRSFGQRVTLGAGLRYSRYDLFLPSDGTLTDTRLTPDDLTGDLRLRFQLAPDVQLLANLGRGFRPPNVFDLGTLGPRPGNRFNIVNPDLNPETVWSYDLGIRAWSERWDLEVFAFLLDYRDRITSVPTGELTDSGRIIVRSENSAESSISGLEASLQGQLTDTLSLDVVLNYTYGTEQARNGPETPADRIPPLNGRVGLAWTPQPSWRFTAWTSFAAEQDRLSPRDRLDPRIDPTGTDSWLTLNGGVEWQPREDLRLGMQLTNGFDRSYREHGSGIDAPGLNLGLWLSADL
ncbi:MAG: TonB-dependent receptor, partial [Pseudomonadota bacterium]